MVAEAGYTVWPIFKTWWYYFQMEPSYQIYPRSKFVGNWGRGSSGANKLIGKG